MTSLLGKAAQILIYPRPSPCMDDVGLLVRHPTQQPPLNKESPCKLIFLHTWKTIYSIEISNLHCAGQTCLCEAQIAVSCIAVKFSRAQLALYGPTVPFAPICRVEYHLRTRLSLGYSSNITCCAFKRNPTCQSPRSG